MVVGQGGVHWRTYEPRLRLVYLGVLVYEARILDGLLRASYISRIPYEL